MKDFYFKLIKQVFPNSLVTYTENLDDINSEFTICPLPGDIIRFQFSCNNDYFLTIKKSILSFDFQTVTNTLIFRGDIPAKNIDPDFDFIKSILKNYNLIG
jgi:hypothetical protein